MNHESLWADVDGYLGAVVIQEEDLAGLTVQPRDRWEEEEGWALVDSAKLVPLSYYSNNIIFGRSGIADNELEGLLHVQVDSFPLPNFP